MARSALRRLERFTLGLAFGFVAWVVERRVLRSIRRRGATEPRRAMLLDQATSELERPSG